MTGGGDLVAAAPGTNYSGLKIGYQTENKLNGQFSDCRDVLCA